MLYVQHITCCRGLLGDCPVLWSNLDLGKGMKTVSVAELNASLSL